MLKITATVEGEQQIVRSLDRFTAGVSDLRPAFEDIGIDVREILVEHFAQEGNGWAPLTPAYAAKKRRLYGDKPILRATDRMFESLTSRDAAGNITEIGEMAAAYGTNVFYARYHQTGTSRMAQRKIFSLTEENKRRIMRTLQRYLVTVGRSSGLHITNEKGAFQQALT